MTKSSKTLLLQWIEKADHDILACETIIEHQPIILDVACFHCQQAVEKYLKLFLLYNKQEIIKTHNLDILLKNCSDIDIDFKSVDVKNMENFAVRVRYPHDSIIPSMKETKEYYQITLNIKKLVLKKIKL